MFGLGKKKDAEPPQNLNLGNLLDAMMRDPEKNQDAFYKAFLVSNVFLIGEAGGEPGEKVLQGGDKVQIMHWADPNGNPFMPVFTSLDEFRKSVKDIDGDVNYMAFTGYDALNLTQGSAPVAIDPMNDHCLYLIPPQVAQILNYFDSIKGSL